MSCKKIVAPGRFCFHDPPVPPPPTLRMVTVEYELFVLAEDSWEAEHEARRAIEHDVDKPDSVSSHEVTELSGVPKDWREAVPFGGDGLKTCREIIESRPPPPFSDPNQMRFPW